jgi:small subunit ribosomal protein S18
MLKKKRGGNKKGKQSNFAKLSIFQPNKYKFTKT